MIIDNQFADYRLIYDKIQSVEYDVYPKPDREKNPDDYYTKIIDYVRIYLNPYYQERSKKALEKLILYIKNREIELLIIDYKLSGTYDGKTGVDLLIEINGSKKIKHLNYLFLSRTSKKIESVQKKMQSLPLAVEWIEKDESGLKMDDPSYFQSHIIQKLPKLLGKPKFERHIDMFESFMKTEIAKDKIADLRKLLKTAKENGYFNPGHIAILEAIEDVFEVYKKEELLCQLIPK